MDMLILFTSSTRKMGLHYNMMIRLMMIVGRREYIDQALSLLRKNGVYYGLLTRSGQKSGSTWAHIVASEEYENP